MNFDRRDFLAGMSGLGMGTLLSGCGSEVSSAPTNFQTVPSGPVSRIEIEVFGTAAGQITDRFLGLSYEKSSLQYPRLGADNADMIGMFKRLGPGLLRLGAASVDSTHWTPAGLGRTSGQVAPSDIDSLAAFLRETGWTILYGVNLATSTPSAAAAEVAYAVSAFGNSLYGVEFGNECDEYPGHYFPTTWKLNDFIELWEEFRAAVLVASPGVIITGPASINDVSGWTVPFGKQVTKSQISLLTQHYYRANGQAPTSTAGFLLSQDPALQKMLDSLAAGAASIGVPFRMTENNSYYNGGANGVSDSFASSLWVLDHLFAVAFSGSTGINLHGGGDSAGYTPIADNAGTVVEARPEYYGLLLFALAGQGSLLTTSNDAGGLNVTAYAVSPAEGLLNVIVVNKEEIQNCALTIDVGRPASAANILTLTGPSLLATDGIAIQGSQVDVDGSFVPGPPYVAKISGSSVTCFVDALSAILVQITL